MQTCEKIVKDSLKEYRIVMKEWGSDLNPRFKSLIANDGVSRQVVNQNNPS